MRQPKPRTLRRLRAYRHVLHPGWRRPWQNRTSLLFHSQPSLGAIIPPAGLELALSTVMQDCYLSKLPKQRA
jgi:hypothetical protein